MRATHPFRATAIIVAAFAAAGCEPVLEPLPLDVAAVHIVAPSRVQVGASFRVSAMAVDATGTALPVNGVEWRSTDERRATVDGTGSGRAVATGPVKLVATVGGARGETVIEIVQRVEPITAVLDSLRTAWNLPALGGAIVTADGVVALDVVGRRRASTATPVALDDRFHLGSNLKAMTAGLIARLVDDGLLSWDTRLPEALPDLADAIRPEYRDRTVADLLAHAAGLPAQPHRDDLATGSAAAQRSAVAARALREQPVGPGGAFNYSDVGYIIAGLIAETAAGRPFEQLITERLFAPLRITTAGFGVMGTPGAEDQPWQHYISATNQRVEVEPGPAADLPLAFGPAGRAYMSLPDWARFIQAVLRANTGATAIWSVSSSQRLTTARVHHGQDGYALGWAVTRRDWAPGPILVHGGSSTLSYSVAWVVPEAGYGIIIVTNQGGALAAIAADEAVHRLRALLPVE